MQFRAGAHPWRRDRVCRQNPVSVLLAEIPNIDQGRKKYPLWNPQEAAKLRKHLILLMHLESGS